MNPFRELAQALKEHKTAAKELTGAAMECSDTVCEYRLPKPLKSVKTDTNFARPA